MHWHHKQVSNLLFIYSLLMLGTFKLECLSLTSPDIIVYIILIKALFGMDLTEYICYFLFITNAFNIYCYAERHHAECRILFIVMLTVIMLNGVMLTVIMLNGVMLTVIMLSAIVLSVVMPSALCCVSQRTFIILSVFMLSVVAAGEIGLINSPLYYRFTKRNYT
jgi:hypothetical protein